MLCKGIQTAHAGFTSLEPFTVTNGGGVLWPKRVTHLRTNAELVGPEGPRHVGDGRFVKTQQRPKQFKIRCLFHCAQVPKGLAGDLPKVFPREHVGCANLLCMHGRNGVEQPFHVDEVFRMAP